MNQKKELQQKRVPWHKPVGGDRSGATRCEEVPPGGSR